jgi:hypothetical protein
MLANFLMLTTSMQNAYQSVSKLLGLTSTSSQAPAYLFLALRQQQKQHTVLRRHFVSSTETVLHNLSSSSDLCG